MALSSELIYLIYTAANTPELGEDPYEDLLASVEAEIESGLQTEYDKIEEFRDELELVEIVEVQSGLLFMCDLSLERRARSGFRVDMIIDKSHSAFDHAPPKNWNIQYGVPTDPVLN